VVEESRDEDHVEEFFGQLWSIPHSLERARVSNQASYGGHLVWIRSDLVKSRNIRPEDCFSVGRHEKIVDKPKTVSFLRDIWARGGSHATFAEVLKQPSMAERAVGLATREV
jgi:hypothetical protein